jgi:hypothetical protein
MELRKAIFDSEDEGWYSLKFLKPHDDSFSPFYCGQIFLGEEHI